MPAAFAAVQWSKWSTLFQAHCLAVLLQLRDKLVPLSHNVVILFVLFIRPIRFNHAINAINRAGDAIAGDEILQIAMRDLAEKWLEITSSKILTDQGSRP